MLRQVGGPHVQAFAGAPAGPQAWDLVVNRHAGSLKFLSTARSREGVERFHANNPRSPVSYRLVAGDDLAGLLPRTHRTVEELREFRWLADKGLLHAETPINEAFQAGAELSRHAAGVKESARVLADNGIKPVGFNFSVGNPSAIRGATVNGVYTTPDMSDLRRIVDTVALLVSLGGSVGYHAYTVPWAVGDDWLDLRYRRMHQELLELGVRARWWLGETLLDHGIVDGRLGGWKWGEWQLNAWQTAQILRKMLQAFSSDLFVVAASVYTAGGYHSHDPQADWTTFEIADQPDIVAVFGEQYEIGQGNQGGDPDVPIVNGEDIGQGYTKFLNLLGRPLENEVYHFPGSAHETSLAVFERGKATWSKATNTTVAETTDGQIWTDRGNRGDGVNIWRIQ